MYLYIVIYVMVRVLSRNFQGSAENVKKRNIFARRINASHLLVMKSLAKYYTTAGCNGKHIHGTSVG